MENWQKILQELEPINQSQKLDERIYKMLRKTPDFTPDTADEFKEEHHLLNQIMLAHLDFQEHPKNGHEGFGDLFGAYLEDSEQLNTRAGQFFTPMHVVKLMAQIMHNPKGHEDPQYFSDPAAGCGRFMLKVAEYYHEEMGMYNFLYHNVDIDKRMFIYCTMNAILYAIPSVNIWGDSLSMEFWEGFMVFKPLGLPTQWHYLDKDQVQQFVPRFEIPKRGLENFMEIEPSVRTKRERPRSTAKPAQKKLFG